MISITCHFCYRHSLRAKAQRMFADTLTLKKPCKSAASGPGQGEPVCRHRGPDLGLPLNIGED